MVVIQEDLKVQPFAGVIPKAALSPQLGLGLTESKFKDK